MPKRLLIILLTILSMLSGARATLAQTTALVTITVIHTADEHGWLEAFTPRDTAEIRGGAANIYSWWVENEGYDPATFLLLSSGDNWTGPALSTTTQGAAMVEAFNVMGYDASAIGNHEFDFGREVMEQRFAEADYPYLSANIRYADSGAAVDFALPYVIQEVNGVSVGIIGLTQQWAGRLTNPAFTGDLVFDDYAEALSTYVPQMRDEGAAIILVLAHACPGELASLARDFGDQIDALFAGHCHEVSTAEINGAPILSSGEYWGSYSRLTLTYDPVAGTINALDYATVEVAYPTGAVNPVTPAADLVDLVDRWQAEIGAQLDAEIGYTAAGIERGRPAMGNWITDSWLWAFPEADIAITNWGGMRQDLPAGVITVGDIVGIMPFDNTLVLVEITGAQVAENLACCGGAVAGITYTIAGGEVRLWRADGSELDPAATYYVLLNDFMYNGGDGYLFGEQDPAGYNTGISWRQPLIDYLLALATTPEDPLENYLDTANRGR